MISEFEHIFWWSVMSSIPGIRGISAKWSFLPLWKLHDMVGWKAFYWDDTGQKESERKLQLALSPVDFLSSCSILNDQTQMGGKKQIVCHSPGHTTYANLGNVDWEIQISLIYHLLPLNIFDTRKSAITTEETMHSFQNYWWNELLMASSTISTSRHPS